MLTRLKVHGFKNLLDVDVSFGPFTCVAGPNASGKSNLFDAIKFLSLLAERPLVEAATGIRGDDGKPADVRELFHRVGDRVLRTMRFEAEMIVPATGTDTLGQQAKASTTFLTYRLELAYRETVTPETPSELEVIFEELDRIKIKDAFRHLHFEHSARWRSSAVTGRRQTPLISTEIEDGRRLVKIHQDQRAGRMRQLLASRLPRTALSSSDAAETPTALMARREMQSWRELQLEPSALREPDSFRAPRVLGNDGSHLASTVSYLYELGESEDGGGGEDFLACLSNTLAALIEDVGAIRVERDESRELLTLVVEDRLGTRHTARALSDGTLRFLALAIVEADPRFRGVLCLEEPENGIHPDRIRPMLDLLRGISVDTKEPVGDLNPLRQVIVNTHSPGVVGEVLDDELLVVVPVIAREDSRQFTKAAFRWLNDTWRARASPEVPTVSRGVLISYLNPHVDEEEMASPLGEGRVGPRPRVKDREDMQQLRLSLSA